MHTQNDHTNEKNTAYGQGDRRSRRKREEYGPRERNEPAGRGRLEKATRGMKVEGGRREGSGIEGHGVRGNERETLRIVATIERTTLCVE